MDNLWIVRKLITSCRKKLNYHIILSWNFIQYAGIIVNFAISEVDEEMKRNSIMFELSSCVVKYQYLENIFQSNENDINDSPWKIVIL